MYSPVSKKAIEFDGTYWHSFDILRKSKSRDAWSDDDIRSYHEIKDNYFSRIRGITVLHIKEKSWEQDKQACVNECLRFLSICN
jgi:hypothetical protein